MSRRLVTAGITTRVAAGAKEFVFIPEGKNWITPRSQKDGVEVNVPPARGTAIAAALQAELDVLLSREVQPWFDFEHTRKYPVSGNPKSFRYQPGKGIMCSAEWSGSGKRALRGGDVNYFSPEFYIDEDGIPNGLPDRGPVGGLVTEPAFRDLGRITASEADKPTTDHPKAMDPILSFLITAGVLSQEEAARQGAEGLGRTRIVAALADSVALADAKTKVTAAEKERDELKVKITASEKAAKDAAEKRAADLVTAAVADSRIATADEPTQNYFRERIAAGDAMAEKLLADRPKLNGDLGRPLITAAAADRGANDRTKVTAARPDEHPFEKEARRMVTAGEAKTETEAFEVVAREKPDLYADYEKQFAVQD